MNFSPFSQLYRSIVAEMVANGTPFADSAAEIAFRTWIKSAWLDSGCTSDFAVLYQPATSTTFSVGVRVATSGHKVNVWWGDGTSGSYAPVPNSNTTVSKTWGSAAKRPIVVLGRVTRLEGGGQSFGGRLWANLRSLTYLSCWGCSSVTGSINSLPSGLTLLSCWGCSSVTGSINSLPSGLTYLDCGGCSSVTGSINSLPSGLTYLDCGGCPSVTGSINSLPSGLTFLDCGGCSSVTGSINSLPSGLTFLACGGCSSVTGSINSLPSGLTYLDCGGCTVTYAASSGTRTWANNMRCVSINPPSAGTWTSAMQDAILIDLAAVATWTTEKTLSLAGDCGARTSASNAAYATLQTKGLTTLAVN